MSIQLNDNFDSRFSKPLDDRFGPYANIAEALSLLPSFKRYEGLTIGIGSPVVEYWFDGGILDSNLIVKIPVVDLEWGQIQGNIQNQTDLQNEFATKQDLLGYTAENIAHKGQIDGYASLDSSGKVPSSQLPSYVDDVVEVATYSALPNPGETGKIYITLDTNFIYRWTGSTYVQITQPNAVWGTITGTLSNQTDLQNALNAKQNTLGYTPENVANKSTNVISDQASNIKYPSVKSVYDWAVGLFLSKNVAITPGTKTKISYDANGLITSGTDLSATDIPSGIDATKIGTGIVSNAEFGYLDGVTSAIQTQLDSKQPSLGYTPVANTRTLTINGTSYDLSANRSWTVGDLVSSGNYSNPTWLTALAWGKITSTPTTLSGYGITDAVPSSRTLTINGTTYDLSANRTWTISTATPTLDAVTTAGNTTTNSISVGRLTVATNLIYTDTVNSRVGIGTASPTDKLEILGTTTTSFSVHSTGTGSNGRAAFTLARIPSAGSTSETGWQFLKDASENFVFRSLSAGTATDRMYLYSSGNVGIGTTPTDAGYKLDVNGTVRSIGSFTAVDQIIQGQISAVSGTPTATPSTTGGTLAIGTYYYKIVAVDGKGNTTTGSAEVSATTTTATSSVALSWTAVQNASSYRIYRGTSAGAESVYYTSTTNSYTDTNATSTVGTVPTVNTTYLRAFLTTGRTTIEADSSVTTQTSAVIQATTTNSNLVLSPNGTGAIVASIPDGTATGGNARGANAVDLQTTRGANTNVSSGTNATISGGASNTATSQYSTVSGGSSNTASTSNYATVVGGITNTSSGYSSISGGNTNTVSGSVSVSLGGSINVSSGTRSITIGGEGNTANNSSSSVLGSMYSTASGIQSMVLNSSSGNTASGLYSMVINSGNASGTRSIGFNNATSSSSLGIAFNTQAIAVLYGQFSISNGVNINGGSQSSQLIASNIGALSTGSTLVLSLDGTGTTNLIIPNTSFSGAVNRAWNVTVKWVGVVTTITGTATGVTVGDTITQVQTLGFKRVGGTSSLVGTANTISTNSNTSMSTASMAYTAGASGELALTFSAPIFVGGGTITCRVVAKVELTEVAW